MTRLKALRTTQTPRLEVLITPPASAPITSSPQKATPDGEGVLRTLLVNGPGTHTAADVIYSSPLIIDSMRMEIGITETHRVTSDV